MSRPTMRIGVIGDRLSGQRLGVGRYLEYLLRSWPPLLDRTESVSVLLRHALGNGLPRDERFQAVVLRPALTPLLWENTVLPLRARGLDVLFGPSYTVPLPYRGHRVVAIHSVNEIESGTHGWWYGFSFGALYRASCLVADHVVVPSTSTRDDLERAYGVPRGKVSVVPIGVDRGFQPDRDPDRALKIQAGFFGRPLPFLVFVGKLSARRNAGLLIELVSILKHRHGLPHGLLMFGPNHLNLPLHDLAARWDVTDRVVQVDGCVASHQDLVEIYNAADLFVTASSYEGFSMPLVEAMACGLPVVLSARGALPEIAGQAGCVLQELRPEAYAARIATILTDPAERARLQARSRERSNAFRWEETGGRTLEVLRTVARGREVHS